METRLDYVFQEWQHLGGAVLVAESRELPASRPPEEVVAESTAYCRDSSRLMWVVIDWLIHHIEQLDEPLLLQETVKQGDVSVLGLSAILPRCRKTTPNLTI